MADIKKIHDALLVLHKEFDILNKENERVQGIINGMQNRLDELVDKNPPPFARIQKSEPKKIHRRRKHAKKQKPVETSSNGNGAAKRIPRLELTEEEKIQIKEFDKKGFSGNKIAKTIGRSQSTIARYVREFRKAEGV